MSDLHALLPDFPAADKYAALLAGLETHRVSLSELLTLDAAEVGKRTHLPLLDLQRLCEEVRAQLAQVPTKPLRLARVAPAKDAEEGGDEDNDDDDRGDGNGDGGGSRISTLDPALDAALAGGFPTGVLAEVVGESGAGKTQLLLSLLLAVQLPPPRGLGRKALYISSEAPLATGRLTQIIRSHPDHETLQQCCSLQAIATINTPDLEAQEHILMHQLPVQLSKAEQFGGPSGSFGLVVLDSVAANFRSFFGGGGGGSGHRGDEKGDRGGGGGGGRTGAPPGRGNSLAARSLELTRLGMLLRTLAQKHNLAVVVANQVADRFDGSGQDGNFGDGGLVSLSQQLGGGSGSGSNNSGGLPRQISTMMTSAAKRPRQGGGSMLPPPPATPSQSEIDTTTKVDDPAAKLPPSSMEPPPLPQSLPTSQLPLSATTDFMPSSSQYIPPSQFPPPPPAPPVLQLDHQQRWFTGWGDSPSSFGGGGGARNKTPALGLVWATQLGMRVALIKAQRIGGGGGLSGSGYRPEDGGGDDYDESSSVDRHNTGAPRLRHSWRRWMKVVFAPHVAATGATSASTPVSQRYKSALAARMQGAVEFDITMGGLRAVVRADDAKG